ncbi:MAG: FxsA family protein [Pseudomonadales bacterium]
MRFALIAFITVPLLEMLILIQVGGIIGALPTVGLVVLTATIGIWLLRLEGMATLARVQEKLNKGQLPETELLEGIMLLVGGALLLTPGFVTDAMGFTCIIPICRRPLAKWIIRQGILKAANLSGSSFRASFSTGNFTPGNAGSVRGDFEPNSINSGNPDPGKIASGTSKQQGHTIDGEYHEEK